MARPRVIRLEDGTVELKNFSKERADELIALLNPGKQSEEAPEAPEAELTDLAMGIRENKELKTFEIVSLRYNVDSKRGEVVEVEHAGTERKMAIEKFKMALVVKGLVRR